MKNSVVLDSLSSFVKWSWPRGDEPAGFSWVKQICDPHYDISRCSDANTEYWRIQILLQFKNQLQLLIYSSAQYSDDDGAANTKNLGNMSRGGFPVVIHVVFLLDISATLTKWLFQKNNFASAGNRTRINCLEGSYADHYTTDAFLLSVSKNS